MPASVLELVESERLLPSQFYSAAADSPQRALMRAVLQRALDDLAEAETGAMGPSARRRLPNSDGHPRKGTAAARAVLKKGPALPFCLGEAMFTVSRQPEKVLCLLLPPAPAPGNEQRTTTLARCLGVDPPSPAASPD